MTMLPGKTGRERRDRILDAFRVLCAICRPSKGEEGVRRWIRAIAKDNGWEVDQDDAGNLLCVVPATPGLEGRKLLGFQCHMDMVQEKNAGNPFDFTRDAIRTKIVMREDGEWLTSDCGTTLGTDNGWGLCAALEIAINGTHGPLILLFTADEEKGMGGAKALTLKFLRGCVNWLNLDSEEGPRFGYVGSAGGEDTKVVFRLVPFAKTGEFVGYQIKFSGLPGGHSGGDIHQSDKRPSAIILLAELLGKVFEAAPETLITSFTGGSAHNAIPREAETTVAVSLEYKEAFLAALTTLLGVYRQYKSLGLVVNLDPLESVPAPAVVIPHDVIDFIEMAPRGVVKMSEVVPGLVETSTQIGVVDMEYGVVNVHFLTRSGAEGGIMHVTNLIDIAAKATGGTATHTDPYPGWIAKPDMPLQLLAKKTCLQLFDTEMTLAWIHAGLECGYIAALDLENMDVMSIGPCIKNPHSPDECGHLGSLEDFAMLLMQMAENFDAAA